MKRLAVVVVGIVAWWVVGVAAAAEDRWRTPEAQKAWLAWDRDVGDALRGWGEQPEAPREKCTLHLTVQGYDYRRVLEDWERRRADPNLEFGTSAFPPDPPKPECRAPMF